METSSPILLLSAIRPPPISRSANLWWTAGVPHSRFNYLLNQTTPVKESQLAALTGPASRQTRLMAEMTSASGANSALLALREKLSTLQTAAQKLRPSSGENVFAKAPSSATSSNTNAVRIDRGPSSWSGSLQVNVLQLADPPAGKKAILEINGQEFVSDTNEFKNAGGIAGLDVTALQTTLTTTTNTVTIPGSTVTSSGPPIEVESYNASAEKLRLESAEGLATGDAIKLTGGSIPGLNSNQTYYVDVRGPDIVLYDTKAHAEAAGSEGRIDIGTGQGGGFQEVDGVSIAQQTTVTTPAVTTEVTTTTKNPLTLTTSAGGGAANPSKATAAIKEFVAAYNEVQNFLTNQQAEGGALRNEPSILNLDTGLRQGILGAFAYSELSGSLASSSRHNNLTVEDATLAQGVSGDVERLAALFQDKDSGIAERTNAVISSWSLPLESRIRSLGSSLQTLDEQLARNTKKIEDKRDEILKAFGNITEHSMRIGQHKAFLQLFDTWLAV
jgi:flagellar capping protein FliD